MPTPSQHDRGSPGGESRAAEATDTVGAGGAVTLSMKGEGPEALPGAEDERTTGEQGTTGPAPSSRRWMNPLMAAWDRYQVLELLGAGGMGEVYKALDPRLGRRLAIKFLRSTEPSLVEQFFREARSQARIDDPHVCKVFEVGEAEGQPFIAMQLINGRPLGETMADMSLEQRVQAIRDVAEGLHAAHRLGLIHRDVKPANILVERTAEGGWHPYLVDFGLAREMKSEGQTIFSVEGTPCYMSPEQVEGDLRRLDRRTDVYGLGATLYEALTGVPPFAGLPPLDVIWKVRTEPPRLPRAIDRRIPVDLETIVLKCIEKEPQHRYESARAVADELQRYLDGDPIRARRAGLLYRGWMMARKHKLGVTLTACAAAALIFFAVVAIRARIAALEQSARVEAVGMLAQELGQNVKEMELFMQYAYALPLHDTDREKAVIRTRLKEIEGRLEESRERLGNLAMGPGNYALGRGFLALGEIEEAVRRLELALAHGFAAPEVSLAAGRARGLLYARGRERARRLSAGEAREAKLREVAEEHLQPALRYLRDAVRDAREPPHETAALIALYEGRLDDALEEAERAVRAAPWSYEAMKIQGDVLQSRAALAEEAVRHEEALDDFRRAVALYEAAAAMATSDPLVHDAQAEAWIGVMRLERHRGADLKPAYEEALESSRRSAIAEPRRAAPFTNQAWAHIFYARSLIARGADPRKVLTEAAAAAERAIASGGPDPLVYNSIGAIYWLQAQYEMSTGLEAGESLGRSVEANRRAIELDPSSAWGHNESGIALGLLAERAAGRGLDPARLFSESLDHLGRSATLNPSDPLPRANMAWFCAHRARYELEHGIDPQPTLKLAVEHAEAALKLRPDYVSALDNLGHAYVTLAHHRLQLGEDAAAPLAKSIEAFRSALGHSPADVEVKRGLGAAHLGVARGNLLRGEDPEPALRAARQPLSDALAAAPTDAEAHLVLGELELTAARAAIAERKSPERTFSRAEAFLRRAHELNAASARPLATLAELHRERAAWALGARRAADSDIKEGLRRIALALEINAAMPAYHALQASLLALQARAARDAAARADLLRRARDELTAALRQNGFLAREYQPILADLEARIADAGSKPAR